MLPSLSALSCALALAAADPAPADDVPATDAAATDDAPAPADGAPADGAPADGAGANGAPADAPRADTPKKSKKRKKAKKDAKPDAAKPDAAAERAAKPDDKRAGGKDADGPYLEGAARVGAGALSGVGVYDIPALVAVVDAEATPGFKLGLLDVSLPAEAAHRETWFAPLSETSGKAALSVELRPWRELRGALLVGVAGTARHGWPDLYQPDTNGDPTPTDRYSHVDVSAQARVSAIPLRHNHLRLTYRFERMTWARDPHFDPLLRPNHLTPQDHDEHSADFSWRYLDGPLHLGASLGAFRDDYFWQFARDAHTGATHAGPGGPPANPLLVLWGGDVEPEAEVDLLLDDRLTAGVGWRVRVVLDDFAGYTSRLENRVAVSAESALLRPWGGLALEGKLSLTSRLYADTGYAAGPTHPALDWGDRREARVASLSVWARFPAHMPLHLFADVELDATQTNFPDYEPGVYPESQDYAVERDYQRAMGVLGVELRP